MQDPGDLEFFGSASFDPVAHINDVLKNPTAGESVDTYCTGLALKLQLRAKEVHRILDEMMKRTVESLPRSVRSLETAALEAQGLQKTLTDVCASLTSRTYGDHDSKLKGEGDEAIALLRKLEAHCMRLRTISEALQRVQIISKELEACEACVDRDCQPDALALRICKAREYVVGLSRALTGSGGPSSNSPDVYEPIVSLRSRIGALEDRVASIIRPSLNRALATHDASLASKSLRTLNSLQRVDTFKNQMLIARKASLQATWIRCRAASPGAAPGSSDLLIDDSVLDAFFFELAQLLRAELSFCTHVYGNANEARECVATVFVSAIRELSPPLARPIHSVLANARSVQLRDGELMGAGVLAAGQVGQYGMRFEEIEYSKWEVPRLHSLFALASRFVDDARDVLGEAAVLLEKETLVLFGPSLMRFGSLEQGHVLARLALAVARGNQTQSLTGLVSLSATLCDQVALLRKESLSRCVTLTRGADPEGLVMALEALHGDFSARFRALLGRLRALGRLDRVMSRPSSPALGSPRSPVEVDERKEFDWSVARSVFDCLRNIADALFSFEAFERTMRNTLAGFSRSALKVSWLREDERRVSAVSTFLTRLATDEAFCPLSTAADGLERVHKDCLEMCRGALCAFIDERIMGLSRWPQWTRGQVVSMEGTNLPSFGAAPSESITFIGEHLLTMPEQLEGFAPVGNILSRMLPEGSDAEGGGGAEGRHLFALHWLRVVASASLERYANEVINIRRLTRLGRTQLATDIGYIFNICGALAVSPPAKLQDTALLVNAPVDGLTRVKEKLTVISPLVSEAFIQVLHPPS